MSRQCEKCGGTSLFFRFLGVGETMELALGADREWRKRPLPPHLAWSGWDGLRAECDVLVCVCHTCQWRWTEIPLATGANPVAETGALEPDAWLVEGWSPRNDWRPKHAHMSEAEAGRAGIALPDADKFRVVPLYRRAHSGEPEGGV